MRNNHPTKVKFSKMKYWSALYHRHLTFDPLRKYITCFPTDKADLLSFKKFIGSQDPFRYTVLKRNELLVMIAYREYEPCGDFRKAYIIAWISDEA